MGSTRPRSVISPVIAMSRCTATRVSAEVIAVQIVIPRENAKDLKELPAHVRKALKVVLVEHMDEVLREALVSYDFDEAGARPEYDLQELLAGTPREATTH
jgi:hypothetical protein